MFGLFCLIKIKTVLKIPNIFLSLLSRVALTVTRKTSSIMSVEPGVPGIKEQVKLNCCIDCLDELTLLEDGIAKLRDRVAH